MSRIGNKNITTPDGVKVAVSDDGLVAVEGPKGKLEWQLPDGITLSDGDDGLTFTRASDERRLRALHGTARSLVANMAQGVSEGFAKELEIKGVGFRAGEALSGMRTCPSGSP